MATVYPFGIDGFAQLPVVQDGVSPVRAADINRIRNAIIAIEAEIGIQPSGLFSSLTARLDSLSSALIDGYVAGSSISVEDADGYFNSTNIEDVLAEIGEMLSDVSLVASGLTITDVDGYYLSSNVEDALVEASGLLSRTASSYSIFDADGYYPASANVEEALAEATKLRTGFISGLIGTAEDKTYHLWQNIPFAATLTSSTAMCVSGTADGYLQIDGYNVEDGLIWHSISVVDGTKEYTTNSLIAPGSDLDFVVNNSVSTSDLAFTVVYNRDFVPYGYGDSLLNWIDGDRPTSELFPADYGTEGLTFEKFIESGGIDDLTYSSSGGPDNKGYFSFPGGGSWWRGESASTVPQPFTLISIFNAAGAGTGGASHFPIGSNTPHTRYVSSSTSVTWSMGAVAGSNITYTGGDFRSTWVVGLAQFSDVVGQDQTFALKAGDVSWRVGTAGSYFTHSMALRRSFGGRLSTSQSSGLNIAQTLIYPEKITIKQITPWLRSKFPNEFGMVLV